MAFGRLVEDLGVVDDLAMGPLLVVAVGVGALVLALAAAEVLARRAAGRRLTLMADPTVAR